MKTVLYTNDFEPITVIDLSEWAARYLKESGHVRLAVMDPPALTPICSEYQHSVIQQMKIVNIYAERLFRKGSETLMLFTSDEENALLLKSSFLAGQQRALNDYKQQAFARGFLNALNAIK